MNAKNLTCYNTKVNGSFHHPHIDDQSLMKNVDLSVKRLVETRRIIFRNLHQHSAATNKTLMQEKQHPPSLLPAVKFPQ